jgi:MFS family permease
MALGLAYLFQTWRASFFILAFPAFLMGVILWLATGKNEGDAQMQPDTSENPKTDMDQMHSEMDAKPTRLSWYKIIRALGLIVFLSMGMQIFSSGVRSFLPLYLVDHHGISPNWAGIVISIIAGSGIIGAPLGGAISDRVGRKRVILFALFLSGPLFFAVTRSPVGIPLALSLFFYGLTMSVRMPTMESLIADVVPVGRRTTVLGIYFFMGTETSGLTTPVIGYLIDLYGLEPVFTSVVIGLCLVALIAFLFRKHI